MVSGIVDAQGEDMGDRWRIVVQANVVRVGTATITLTSHSSPK
jgi:hypothetical protein